ncbi:MAG TPA: hypothetical protein VG651_22015 [Stellaceae bacterium]|nr:hypothetical protein [Stellaceae bacterium]
MAEPVTLELLGELMQRNVAQTRAINDELHDIKAELRDIKDQLLVHGAILVRLESRIPLPNDAELAAIQLQVQRLQRRVEALEGERLSDR